MQRLFVDYDVRGKNMNEIIAPIYVITGFLDAGKTSFLNFTIGQDYFQIEDTTLLIVCEEGEEEYDEKFLLKNNTVIEYIDKKEDLTFEKLKEFAKKYDPKRVIVEYNPLWGMQYIEELDMPFGWGIVQEIVMLDASEFKVYMNNMKSLFVDMFRNADMVTFNRCKKDMELANFRRSIKVVNPACEVVFEDSEGEIVDISNELPYDLTKDVIEIEDIDFGIFYVDAGENKERYQNKKVRIHGMVSKSSNPTSDVFVPGRKAMTCCADDMTFIGFLCKSKHTKSLIQGSWVYVTAKINYEQRWEYGGQEGPVLYASKIEKAGPPEFEWVSFS